MTTDAHLDAPPSPPEEALESAKRKQILEGARRVFFAQGFAAASMGEIAREARVSKGTLYVYFDSKESLFAAIIDDSRSQAAEHMLSLDPEDPDVAAVLGGFAKRLIRKLCAPEHVALVRMVIGAAEQFPDLAAMFYRAGPEHGKRLLAEYLGEQHRRGRLVVADPEIAAWQFMGMCCHPVTVHVVLAAQPMPDEARIVAYAEAAVGTLLAAYGVRA